MFSPSRVIRYVRTELAIQSPATLLIGPGILLAVFIFSFYVNQNETIRGSALLAEYLYISAEGVSAIVGFFGWLAMTITAGIVFNRQFKRQPTTEQVLTLPLTQGERYAAQLILLALIVPLFVSLTIFLTYLLAGVLPIPGLMLPGYSAALGGLAIAWLAHLVVTAVWLAPAWSLGKRNGWVIFAVIALAVAYANIAYDDLTTNMSVVYNTDLPAEANVVTVSDLDLRRGEVVDGAPARPTFSLSIRPRPAWLDYVVGLGVLGLYVAAFIALTRKTT